MITVEVEGQPRMEFPDGTSQEVIQRTVRGVVERSRAGAPRPSSTPPQSQPGTPDFSPDIMPQPAAPTPRAPTAAAPAQSRYRFDPLEQRRQMNIGAAGTILGLPGAIEGLGRHLIPRISNEPVLPTPERVERFLERTPSLPAGAEQALDRNFPRQERDAGRPPESQADRQRREREDRISRSVGGFMGAFLPIPGVAGRGLDIARSTIAPSRTVERIGEAIGPSGVGEQIERAVMERFGQVSQERARAAGGAFGRYMREGAAHSEDIVGAYTNELRQLLETRRGDLSPSQAKMFEDSIAQLTTGRRGAPNIEAIDLERRRLRDIEQGLAEEGLDAASRLIAGSLATTLEANIMERVPAAREALDVYRNMSEAVNRYGTALGEKVTRRAGEFLPDMPHVDPARLPGAFFNSRRSVQELRELTGDPALVNRLARQHVADEVQGMRTAQELREYIRKNQDWLREVPDVQQQLRRAAGLLRSGETIRGVGKAALYGAGIGLGLTGGSRIFRSLTGDR